MILGHSEVGTTMKYLTCPAKLRRRNSHEATYGLEFGPVFSHCSRLTCSTKGFGMRPASTALVTPSRVRAFVHWQLAVKHGGDGRDAHDSR
jgi:hypothetical protein